MKSASPASRHVTSEGPRVLPGVPVGSGGGEGAAPDPKVNVQSHGMDGMMVWMRYASVCFMLFCFEPKVEDAACEAGPPPPCPDP